VRHFLFEEKEYRINPYFRRARKEEDSAKALLRLLRGRKGGGGGSGLRAVHHSDTRQKCVVKAQYSSSMAAHKVQLGKYLAREGTARDGGEAILYGDNTADYAAHMSAKNFRIFLSPQSDKTNLSVLADKFVRRVERETGYKLWWQAANHYNTAHPHAHLLINGVDKEGREVVFPRDVVKTFMREAARDLCTAQLGFRTRGELRQEREREVTAARWTKLDERIKSLCDIHGRPNTTAVNAGRPMLLSRLDTLRSLKLCEWKGGGYQMTAKWEENLRANGRYNTFLRARTELLSTNPANLALYTGAEGQVEGKVTKVYRIDGDASDNHAVLLETKDGRAFFVPLFKAPEAREGRDGGKSAVVEGDEITLKAYKTQSGRLTPVMRKITPAGEARTRSWR